jgi:23S rRNA A2030 N6-methylase RlmJ
LLARDLCETVKRFARAGIYNIYDVGASDTGEVADGIRSVIVHNEELEVVKDTVYAVRSGVGRDTEVTR